MSHLLDQIKAWRQRWKPVVAEEDRDAVLNRSFSVAFSSRSGKEVLDYLIETYFKPLEFIGEPSSISLGERNGQQKMLVDILSRVDAGTHPMAFQESPSSEDEKLMDVRQ